MGFFVETSDNVYRTSVRRIAIARRFFRMHPGGELRTGMWNDPVWDRDTWHGWFMEKMHRQINARGKLGSFGRKHTPAYQVDLRHDARVVNDYVGKRARSTGSRGMLRTPEMRARYPHINNQEWED